MRHHIRAALVAAAALAAAPAAVAAPSKAAAAVPQSPGASVEARLAGLHARLKITAAQEARWSDFSAVLRSNAEEVDATYRRRAAGLPTMTAVENVRSYAEAADAHAREAKAVVPAFEALYETMSDSQKRLADQAFRDDRRSAPASGNGK